MSAPRSCTLCSALHFGFLPGSVAPCELQVAGMPIDQQRSTSYSPSTTKIVRPKAIALSTSSLR